MPAGRVDGYHGHDTGPSLVGVSKASGATSRVIAFATGGILILFALSPKIGALFILLPNAVGGGTLLFTASFMIAGGIQIMVSRNIDTRMTFVIGVPIVLGLAREVFQDYFKKLPLVLHPITNSMLSIAVVSTLLLHLVFRLGSKRTAGVTVDDLARPQDEMTALLKEQGQIWNVDAHVIQRAVETTRQVLDHIERAHLVGADLRAQISYDDFRFIVTITYSGTLLNLPNGGVRHRSFLEEESFSYGLADFLTGVYPDHMEAKSHGGKVEIRLFFST